MKDLLIKKLRYGHSVGLTLILLLFISSCKEYLSVPLPVDKISAEAAFTTDKSCAATINSILSTMVGQGVFHGNGIGVQSALYTDELTNHAVASTYGAFYSSVVSYNETGYYWSRFYELIYRCNASIEGVTASTSTLNHRDQWLGEAYLMRAFLHFYLTNIYGDIPIVTTTDYRVNNVLRRSPQEEVYRQIFDDLLQAQALLPENYRDGNGFETDDRGRPNRAAATALLSRVYLYMDDWQNAALHATEIIGQSSLYSLTPLSETFLANSEETVWALAPISNTPTPYVTDRDIFHSRTLTPEIPLDNTLASYGIVAAFSPSLLTAFEEDDQRLVEWCFKVTTIPQSEISYILPYKYQSTVNGEEYVILFRLAEQYLLRAEARAQQNDLEGAKSDLNLVRQRAGLVATDAGNQADLLRAIAKERRTELFTEGHRLFDLRRTGQLDAVMSIEAPLKNGSWTSFQQFWPIPSTELQANPGLTQTPGY